MKYRIWMRSRPGPCAQYDGKVDIEAPTYDEALDAAFDKLLRTAFPNRSRDMWRVDRVEIL